MKTPAFLLLSALGLSLAACAAPASTDPDAQPSQYAAALSGLDAATILAFVNYPGTDDALLDGAVGLDARAASGIVAARDGKDGISPSADDVPFATLAGLDAVPYVGDSAFAKLQAYAGAHPAPAGETVEGVAFTGWESQAVVYGVDHAALTDLDKLLDDRAATALFDARPFTTVAAMGPEPYVGTTALTALRGQALTWWGAMHAQPPSLAGTFNGVTFDATQAPIALAIANQATLAQLQAHAFTTAPANAILGARPYATLAAVAAVKGVGAATMKSLLAYAESGTWVAPGTGFTLDAASIAAETDMMKENLTQNEGFAEYVLDIAGDKNEAVSIMTALMKEIDVLTAPLAGTTYADQDTADAAVDAAAPVQQLTQAGGWTYLASIGVVHPASCTNTFEPAVSPHLGDVLFLSESDRPITLVSYPGAGKAAPTAASVLALVGAPAGSTAALRDPASFFADLEASSSTADMNAPLTIQGAFDSQLIDVVYVAVTPPVPNNVLVQVYLVGRTTCGDLVGMTSISVET